MKLKAIFDWGGFSSTAVLPTLMVGRWERGGWAYLYWWQGRLGVSWREEQV